jgi:phospholipase/carboxylesterase
MAQDAFLDAIGQLGPPLLRGLAALERAGRQLHPPTLPALRSALSRLHEPLLDGIDAFTAATPPPGLDGFCERLARAARTLAAALDSFGGASGPEAVGRVLGAMRLHCRAQEDLYGLRRALPPVSRYFLEPALWERLERLDPDPPRERTGLHHANDARETRGGFTLYVPESYDGDPLPLVVALHGGSGHGADFLWTWLREARGRRFLLLSPTARAATWSLAGPDRDAASLDAMVDLVARRWSVDREHVLLTGLSDGATYSMLCGLREGAPFTALAPVSGVLHPANFANGNLERARGRRIYLVHGALDWMFPVTLARMAAEELEKAGAELTFRELEDLSHTYPREENARILEWFDPRLAVRGTGRA